MAIQLQGSSGTLVEVGGSAFKAQHVHVKPLEHGTLGHYRVTQRINSAAAQAANSRILTLRNSSATTLVIPTRLLIRALQTAAGTAQENSVDVYKATGYSAVDTTSAVTLTPTVKRVNMTAAASAAGQVRTVTQTGVAAGMTGGTITLDANPIATLPYNVAAAINTTAFWGPLDCFDDVNGTHPLVFAQNEGLAIVNRVLNVTSYGITWYIDLCWAEVAAF